MRMLADDEHDLLRETSSCGRGGRRVQMQPAEGIITDMDERAERSAPSRVRLQIPIPRARESAANGDCAGLTDRMDGV